MLKEIKKIKKGVVRITSLNERWYAKTSIDPRNGKKEYVYYPSSTWISSYYPKGVYFLELTLNEIKAIQKIIID